MEEYLILKTEELSYKVSHQARLGLFIQIFETFVSCETIDASCYPLLYQILNDYKTFMCEVSREKNVRVCELCKKIEPLYDRIVHSPTFLDCKQEYAHIYQKENQKKLRALEAKVITLAHKKTKTRRYSDSFSQQTENIYQNFLYLMDIIQITKENIHIIWNTTLFLKQNASNFTDEDFLSIKEREDVKQYIKRDA